MSALIFGVVLGATQVLAKLPAPAPLQPEQATSADNVLQLNSESAGDLLDATNQARNALFDFNKPDAMRYIDRGIEYANQLQSRTDQRFIPIYAELSRYSVIGPIVASREQREVYNAETAPPQGIQSTQAQYTSVSLDVPAAKENLYQAKRALSEDDFRVADNDLRAVEDGISVGYVSSDVPLLQARENLILARDSAMQGYTPDTYAALREACQALQNYSNAGGMHARQADQLRSTISSFIQNAPHSGPNQAATIESWWTQLTHLTPVAGAASQS